MALFAPFDNLEQEDLQTINSAQSTIDIAMYAFTDRQIAMSLENAAARGVRIRIYRDAEQFADEQVRQGTSKLMEELSTYKGIQVKVKKGRTSMHLKAYCVDQELLRTGSANWSEAGELAQDNDLYLITSKQTISKFEDDFDEIWNRPDNQTE